METEACKRSVPIGTSPNVPIRELLCAGSHGPTVVQERSPANRGTDLTNAGESYIMIFSRLY